MTFFVALRNRFGHPLFVHFCDKIRKRFDTLLFKGNTVFFAVKIAGKSRRESARLMIRFDTKKQHNKMLLEWGKIKGLFLKAQRVPQKSNHKTKPFASGTGDG